MRKVVLLCLLFLGVTSVLVAQEQGIRFRDNETWENVVKEAVRQDKKIFVDCYTSWCGPCKLLAKEVFTQRKVGEFFNMAFVNVKYDMEKTEGLAFGKLYEGEVVNYPTMLVIDPLSGEILHKFVGRRSADELIYEASQGLKDGNAPSLSERYESGERDYAFIKDYVLSLKLEGEKEEVMRVIDNYFNTNASFDELLVNRDKWDFFSQYLYDLRTDLVQFVITNYGRLRGKSYVNAEGLRQELARLVYEGAENLLDVGFQNGQVTELGSDIDFYQVLKDDLRILRNFENRETCVALLRLYERLSSQEWEKAIETLAYMREFEMDRALCVKYVPVSVYVAKYTDDKALLKRILESLRTFQTEEERKAPHVNHYDAMAFVAERLGDAAGAKTAIEKYEKLKHEREVLFKRMNTRNK